MKIEENSYNYVPTYIDLQKIIVFPQTRITFDKLFIQELADDIAEHGLIYQVLVADLSEEKFIQYKIAFEEISGEKLHDLSEYPYYIDNGKRYLVLIAGHQRYEAHMLLWKSGCTQCKNEGLVIGDGSCFLIHAQKNVLQHKKIFATQCKNISPIDAKSMQLRENSTRVNPPIHEEAQDLRRFYNYLKQRNSKLTISEFARKFVGISDSKARKALWYSELPQKFQDAVRDKHISFTNALQVRRIIENYKDSDRLSQKLEDEYFFLFSHPNIKTEHYRIRVTNCIEEKNQSSLFDAQEFTITTTQKRKVVALELLKALQIRKTYFAKVEKLLEQDLLGKGKVFSELSPEKQIKEFFMIELPKLTGIKLTKIQQKKLEKLSLAVGSTISNS